MRIQKKSLWIVIAAAISIICGLLYLFVSTFLSFRRQVRSSSYINSAFDFSPMGNLLVFTNDGVGGSDLFLLNKKHNAIRCLAKTPEYEGEPSFSPDGKWIVYTAAVPGEDADHIFMRSVDGKQVKQLTNEHKNDKDPVFSPNGSYVVFARNEHVTGGFQAPTWSGYCRLYKINVDGSRLQRLSESYLTIIHPQFTPDGRSVLFAAIADSSEGDLRQQSNDIAPRDIYMIEINSKEDWGEPKQLTQDGDIEYVSVAPDGKLLVTQSVYGLIYIKNRDGTTVRNLGKKLTEDLSGYAVKPTFSSDGKHIIFLLRGHNNQSALWQSDLNGENVVGISEAVLFSDPLGWRKFRR